MVIFLLLVGLVSFIYYRAQQQKVSADNVNAEWDEGSNSVVPAADSDVVDNADPAKKFPVA